MLKALKIAITILFACAAYGQPPSDPILDRILHFTNTPAPQGRQEITNAIRSIAEIGEAFVDNQSSTLAIRGTASQIALADWLVQELDRPARPWAPAPQSQGLTSDEYPGASSTI